MNDELKAVRNLGAELGAAKAECERLRTALKDLICLAEDQICQHHNTHRGGAIWEICDGCGMQWADDMGGRPEFMWPDEIESARAALSQQAEPDHVEDMRAMVEPAPAQDEREAATDAAYAAVVDGGWSSVKEMGVKMFQAGAEWVRAAPIAQTAPLGKFRMGDLVKKSTGSEWEGRVVGWYSTEQTKEGYAVESSAHRNSVQIYPAKALELVPMAAKEA